jgi:hypothetical protein
MIPILAGGGVHSSGLSLAGVNAIETAKKDKRIFPFLINVSLNCYQIYCDFRSRNSVDGVATRLRPGWFGFRIPAGTEIFFLPKMFIAPLGPIMPHV